MPIGLYYILEFPRAMSCAEKEQDINKTYSIIEVDKTLNHLLLLPSPHLSSSGGWVRGGDNARKVNAQNCLLYNVCSF